MKKQKKKPDRAPDVDRVTDAISKALERSACIARDCQGQLVFDFSHRVPEAKEVQPWTPKK